MAELQTKTCLYCAALFDNQGQGMSAKRFASRVYCSKACDNKSRTKGHYSIKHDQYELQPLMAVVAKIDIEAPLFKFLSGQHQRECQAKHDSERFLHPGNVQNLHRAKLITPDCHPRHDEIFEAGVAWLDSLDD
jgi:hypothetical protein